MTEHACISLSLMPLFNVAGFSHMLSLCPNLLVKCMWTQPCRWGVGGGQGMGFTHGLFSRTRISVLLGYCPSPWAPLSGRHAYT